MNIVKKNVDLPSIFDELFPADWFGGIANQVANTTNTPAVNIKETENDFVLEVAAPGKAKEDFELSLDHDVLTISTEEKKEDETVKDNYTRKEFSYASFKRSFKLPQMINKKEINATYVNGILNVVLPKREEDKVKPKRTIEIS